MTSRFVPCSLFFNALEGNKVAMGATAVTAIADYARSLLRRNGGAFYLPAGGILIVAAVAAVGGTIWQLRADAIEEAQRDTANLAIILAEQAERSVQAIDFVVRELQDDIQRMAFDSPETFEAALADEGIHRRLAARLTRLPQADALALISARGTSVNSSRSWPAPAADFSDRDYVQHFSAADDPHAFVSAPVKSRVTGRWTIYLARAINSPEGKLLGVILAGVELRYFEQIFRAIDLPRHETFSLLRRDGIMLVRVPDRVGRVGFAINPASPWHEIVAKGSGTYLSPGVVEGKPRMITVQPLRDYPLVINVGVNEDAVLAVWRNQAFFIAAAASLLLVFAAFLARMVRRQLRRLRESEASLTRQNEDLIRLSDELSVSERHLAEKSRVLGTTLATMDQGLMIIDPAGTIVLSNKRAAKLLELPEALLAARPTLHELLDYQWRTNLCGRDEGSFEEFAGPRLVLDRQNFQELRWPNGRVVEIRSIPRDGGGAVRTYTDITERKRVEERARFFANHDDLTRLVNRSMFRKRLEETIALASSDRRGLAVFYLDLDRFKQVNDTRGHEVGDRVLVECAKRMRSAVRSIDVIARIGGDEFAIILPFLQESEPAEHLAKRLVALMAEPFVIDDESLTIGASIGVALFPQHGSTIDALLRHADQALYEAKRSGRNTFCIAGLVAAEHAVTALRAS
jgi:diguanylate cyclase (GGDEF)-like protein